MKDFLNLWYKHHNLIYKVLLFTITTFSIVYIFPKSGKFKYSFEKGKPWQSEDLLAPFDFAIKKSQNEIDFEIKSITDNAPAFFDIDEEVYEQVKRNFNTKFNSQFTDSLQQTIVYTKKKAFQIIEKFYEHGNIDTELNYNENKIVTILSQNKELKTLLFSKLITPSKTRDTFEELISEDALLIPYKNKLLSLFFDVIKPNLTLNQTITDNALQDELNKISEVRGRIDRQTLIISKGEVVEGEKFNVLNSLVSEYESKTWTQSNYNYILAAYACLVSLALLMLFLFLRKYRLEIFNNNTKITFIFFNILFMMVLTTLVVNYKTSYVYLVPLCILPLVLKAFFDARLGLFTHVITVLLLGFIVTNNYEYMFLQIIAGIVTILTVSELYKRANLFISVGQITLIYMISYFAFYVIHEGGIDNLKWETFLLFIIGGVATLFVQPLIYAYEKIFGLVSDVSLLELSDTNSKLLKQLSNNAPGTFHHSLNVANLAEAAANEIGGNSMLVRVGALYHDIGKMDNPTYFTENQSAIINPHNELSAKESASIIKNHVIQGVEIAKKNNIPDRIIDFIRTHHGTSLIYYFYMKEKTTVEDIDEKVFRYRGPKPFSKETAILMMCDSVEAASKSIKEPTSLKIDSLVENIVNKQIEDQQFLNANITFKEIQTIKKVLKHKLANIYHLRLEYPE